MNYIRALGGFNRRRDAQLLVEADLILTQMEDNPAFPNPIPPLEEIEVAYNQYTRDLAVANARRGVYDWAVKRDSKAKLAYLLGELANYVNYMAKGKLSVLYSSGFRVFTGRKKGDVPETPLGGKLSDGPRSGQLRYDFDSVGRDILYEYTYAIWTEGAVPETDNDRLKWEETQFTSRSRNNPITDLPPGATIFAKVRARNRHGVSGWSNVTRLMVR